MKVKMYTKAIHFPFEGTPYEKTICIVYDSIDDINTIDVGKITLIKDTEVYYPLGDTDCDIPLRNPVVYSNFAQDTILFAKKMLCDKWSKTVRKT